MSKRAGVTHSDSYNVDAYLAALEAAGVTPILISPKCERNLDDLDGLVLCGGTDLNPDLYGEPRDPEADDPEDNLDKLELALLLDALDRDLPVLAICRGLQLFNVAHRGTLDQHIAGWSVHRMYKTPKPQPTHMVEVVAGSRLAAITGPGEVAVNSRHHQAVKKLGDGLIVSARARDGVIEGLERADRKFAVAVQWHPEDQATIDPIQAGLFSAFGAALSDELH